MTNQPVMIILVGAEIWTDFLVEIITMLTSSKPRGHQVGCTRLTSKLKPEILEKSKLRADLIPLSVSDTF